MLRQGLMAIIHPFGLVRDSMSEAFQGKGNLDTSIRELSQRIHELELENASLQILKEENESLRRDLNFSKRIPLRMVGAHVIGMSTDIDRRMVVIDKGSDTNIKKKPNSGGTRK